MTASTKLKVYGVNLNGIHRGIVAASSQKEAARLLRLPLVHLQNFGSITGNAEEVELAMSTPGVAYQTSQCSSANHRWSVRA